MVADFRSNNVGNNVDATRACGWVKYSELRIYAEHVSRGLAISD